MLISTILFLLYTIYAQAEPSVPNKVQVHCSLPTTTFSVDTFQDKVVTKITHPYGYKYTPIARGAISPISLDQIKAQAEIVATLGNEQEFQWPLADCLQKDESIFSCSKGEHKTINGWKIRPISFRTYKSTQSLISGDYAIYTVEVVYLVENAPQKAGTLFSFSADFSKDRHCH